MRLPGNYVAPRYTYAEFCGDEPLEPLPKKELLARVAAAAARRWPGQETACHPEPKRGCDDPFTDVDPTLVVLIVCRYLTIVTRVSNPDREISIAELPRIGWKPKLGQKWYENIAFVLVAPSAVAG